MHAVSKTFELSVSCGLNTPDIGTAVAFARMKEHQQARDLSLCDDCQMNGVHVDWKGLCRAFRDQCKTDQRPVPPHLA